MTSRGRSEQQLNQTHSGTPSIVEDKPISAIIASQPTALRNADFLLASQLPVMAITFSL